MNLYSVTIAGSYPMQCAVVTDCKERAASVCYSIRKRFPHLSGVTYVEKVESFYPGHMTDCDKAVSDFLINDYEEEA